MDDDNDYSDDFESASTTHCSTLSARERIKELGSGSLISPSPRLVHRRVVRGYKLATSSSFNYSDDFFTPSQTTLTQDNKSYGSDTFESEPESKRSSYQYGTDTFVSETHTGSPLQRTLSSQSSVDYSDTFESTDIVSPTENKYQRDISVDTLESDAETGSWESGTESETTTEDSLDRERAAEAREMFIELKIQQAQNPAVTPEEQEIRPPHPKMKDFCAKKIRTAVRNADHLTNEDWSMLYRSEPKERIAQYGVSEGLIEKLRLDNLMIKMKKMAKDDNHDPEKCSKCRQNKEKLEENHFLKQKLRLVSETNINEKLKTVEVTDALCHLGDMVHTLPNPMDKPENIWQRLMKPLESRPLTGS